MLNYQTTPSQIFQALADPTRLAIVDRLAQGGASVSELAEPFDMSLAAVVQHVQALEAAGLIITKKSGRTRRCTINLDALHVAESWLAQRRRFWERQFDRLDTVLNEDA